MRIPRSNIEELPGLILGTGMAGLGVVAVSKCGKDAFASMNKNRKKEKDKEYREALLRDFRKKNGEKNHVTINGFENAAAIPPMDHLRDKIKNMSEKDKEEMKKIMKDNPVLRGIIKYIMEGDPTKPGIVTGKKMVEAGTVSHEIGHTEYFDNSDNGRNKLVKIAHRYPALITGQGWERPLIGGFVTGAAQGITGGAGVLRKGFVGATGLETVAVLVRELSASKRGLELLKKLGADEDELKIYRKELMNAFGTYVFNGVYSIGAAMASARLGKIALSLFK